MLLSFRKSLDWCCPFALPLQFCKPPFHRTVPDFFFSLFVNNPKRNKYLPRINSSIIPLTKLHQRRPISLTTESEDLQRRETREVGLPRDPNFGGEDHRGSLAAAQTPKSYWNKDRKVSLFIYRHQYFAQRHLLSPSRVRVASANVRLISLPLRPY